ncbi:MAG: hypothetical protein ABJC39_05335 [Chloroflexota bacterium]
MVWDDSFDLAATTGVSTPIEIVGTNLRLTGTISLGRFGRLTDLINASSGYLRVRDARLLRRNGDPTSLVLPELMIDQDEISYIAQQEADAPEPGSAVGFIEPSFGGVEIEARKAREFVLFTPGHTVTGKVHVFGQTDLAGFVDSTDPRFVPVTGVTTRSLADTRIVSRYAFVLINRTQMIAAAEVGRPDEAAETGTRTVATEADLADLKTGG